MAKDTFSSIIDLFKTSSSSSVSLLVCDICGSKLSVLRKKKPCVECKRQFCSHCIQRSRDRTLRCINCHVLTMRPPLRPALLDLRVKDLQHYLNRHNVSTRGCLEKEDLVNVLLRYASTAGYVPAENSGNPPPGNSRHPLPESLRNPPSDHLRNPPSGNSGPSNTIPPSSCPTSVHPSSNNDTAGPILGDSDSSSDTSFEIVQRPSSNENIMYAHSSSSSVSGISVQGNTSPSAPFATSPSTPSLTRVPETATVPDAPLLVQTSVDEVAAALGSLSVHSELNTAITVASTESDVPNTVLQDTLEVNSQPSQSQPNSSNNSPSLIRGTMASITSESDFESFSVKQLKDILHRHRVNYHGCCEKAELVEKAKRLYRDYCTSRADLEKLDLDALCKICMDAPVECVMLECGHMATCTDCGRQLSECPICRQFVVRIVRTFKA